MVLEANPADVDEYEPLAKDKRKPVDALNVKQLVPYNPTISEGHNGNSFQQPKKAAMVEAYALLGNISHAASKVGISRAEHYAWLQDDPDYATAVEHAKEVFADHCEHIVFDEAGLLPDANRSHRNILALFFATKAKRPEYRDNANLTINNNTLNVTMPKGALAMLIAAQAELTQSKQATNDTTPVITSGDGTENGGSGSTGGSV